MASNKNPIPSVRMLSRNFYFALALCFLVLLGPAAVAASNLSGNLTDPQGSVVIGGTVRLSRWTGSSCRETQTDSQGRFFFTNLVGGDYRLTAEYPGFAAVTRNIALSDGNWKEDIRFSGLAPQRESVTVTADVNDASVLAPDPALRVFVRQDLLDANPGRPGPPVSIPGYPIETASSGIKAPQYFAPGVAGDHGEPIAQFVAVGGYLVPNNLSANAHGNGYADPNIFVPEIVESVQIDGGSVQRAGGESFRQPGRGFRATLSPRSVPHGYGRLPGYRSSGGSQSVDSILDGS